MKPLNNIIRSIKSEVYWKERIVAILLTFTYIVGNGLEYVQGQVTHDPPAVWMLGILIGLGVIGLSLSKYKNYTSIAFKFFLLYLNFNIILGYAFSTAGDKQSELFYLLSSYAIFVICSQGLDSPRELVLFTAAEVLMVFTAVYIVRDNHPLLLQSMHIFTFGVMMLGNFMIHYQRISLTQISGSTIQFRNISENARDIQCIVNSNFDFIYINPSVKDIAGYTAASLPGKSFLTLVAEEDQPEVTEALNNIKLQPNAKQSAEYRIKTITGAEIWVESIFSCFNTAQTGAADLIFVETRNIEIRKKLEEEIKQQLRIEEMLIKHSNQFINVGRSEIQNGIDVALGEFGTMLGSDAVLVYRMHGKLQDEFRSTNQWVSNSGLPLLKHFNLSIKINQQLVGFLRSLRGGGKASHGSFFEAQSLHDIQAMNTTEIPGRRFYLVPLQSGNIVNGFVVFAFGENIGHIQSSFFGLIGNMVSNAFTRMRTEMRLHEAQLTNEAILRALPDWLYIINKNAEFTGTNNSSTLPDYIPDYGLIGKTFSDVMPKDIADLFTRGLHEVMDTEMASSFEYHDTSIYKDRYFKAIIAPFKASEYLIIIRDVTDLKFAQIELLSKAAKLESSNKELEEFAYVVSHDMKQPIRTIISYLSLLKRKHMADLKPDAQEFVNFSIEGANKMSDLIRDILQYSRLEQEITLTKNVSLNGIISKVRKNLNDIIVTNKAEVVVDELPPVTANETMLTELFQNLIENGIKYNLNPNKKVTVTVTDKISDWQFQIADNGIGFDQQYAQQIFKIFKRLHTDGEFQGTGIGLTICQKVVDKHGGKIWAESVKGEGSKFIFTLPKQEN